MIDLVIKACFCFFVVFLMGASCVALVYLIAEFRSEMKYYNQQRKELDEERRRRECR